MKKLTLAAIALSAVAGSFQTSAVASPPEPNGPRGRLCSYSASSDPSPEAGEDAMTGQINAGPLLGEPGGELYCTLQVNNNLHSGPDTLVRSSGPADSTGISIIVSADVAYVSAEDAQDYLCTSYKKADGTWLYWHPTDTKGNLDPTDDEPGHWTRNLDNSKPCSAATQFSTRPIWEAADSILFCPALMALHNLLDPDHDGPEPGDRIYIDHEGDVFIDDDDPADGFQDDEWWFDCPYYIEDGADANDPNDPGVIDY